MEQTHQLWETSCLRLLNLVVYPLAGQLVSAMKGVSSRSAPERGRLQVGSAPVAPAITWRSESGPLLCFQQKRTAWQRPWFAKT